MKTISKKPLKNGMVRVTVDIEVGTTLLGVRPNIHYKLGQPVDDVVASHIIEDAVEVVWCSASQQWVS